VNTVGMINVSDSANEAFGGFNWEENGDKGVRLFVQGFG
jgi:hypothetical protein